MRADLLIVILVLAGAALVGWVAPAVGPVGDGGAFTFAPYDVGPAA